MRNQIPDELLAAYLDGNTSSIEILLIEAELDNNPETLEATDIWHYIHNLVRQLIYILTIYFLNKY